VHLLSVERDELSDDRPLTSSANLRGRGYTLLPGLFASVAVDVAIFLLPRLSN